MAVTTGPDILSGDAGVYNKQTYEKKTFGIWNVMVQKRFNKKCHDVLWYQQYL